MVSAPTNSSITYILINGIAVSSPVRLGEGLTLEPANTAHIDFQSAVQACCQPDDIAVIAAFIPRIKSQFKVFGLDARDTARRAWNSMWDALLLSAIFHTPVGFNIQSDTTAEQITANSKLRSIHREMNGFDDEEHYTFTSADVSWLESHFCAAQELVKIDKFQTAVQCLSSYRWHRNPRIQLAIIWAGIEGFFNCSTEISFRLSLYIANFLHEDDPDARKTTFEAVKKLYGARSKAVHGQDLSEKERNSVKASAKILQLLIHKAIENRSLPEEDQLIF